MFVLRQYFLLFITATIWGSGFVGQKLGIEHISPFAFTFFRTFIGALVLLPVLWLLNRGHKNSRADLRRPGRRRDFLLGSLCCGACLITAESFQQFGMVYTEVSKASFITAMYIIFVPLLSVFLGQKTSFKIWLGVALSVAGLYLLCVKSTLSLQWGDALVLTCAVAFAFHILVIAHFVTRVDGVLLSCGQFFTASFFGLILMLAFDIPTFEEIIRAAPAFIYCGVMSNGIAYTLQVVGQRGVNPTIATLIMSLESVMGCLFGVFFLGDILTASETAGCALMFAAVIVAQLPSFKRGSKEEER